MVVMVVVVTVRVVMLVDVIVVEVKVLAKHMVAHVPEQSEQAQPSPLASPRSPLKFLKGE